jgi:hypothetical protein
MDDLSVCLFWLGFFVVAVVVVACVRSGTL